MNVHVFPLLLQVVQTNTATTIQVFSWSYIVSAQYLDQWFLTWLEVLKPTVSHLHILNNSELEK